MTDAYTLVLGLDPDVDCPGVALYDAQAGALGYVGRTNQEGRDAGMRCYGVAPWRAAGPGGAAQIAPQRRLAAVARRRTNRPGTRGPGDDESQRMAQSTLTITFSAATQTDADAAWHVAFHYLVDGGIEDGLREQLEAATTPMYIEGTTLTDPSAVAYGIIV